MNSRTETAATGRPRARLPDLPAFPAILISRPATRGRGMGTSLLNRRGKAAATGLIAVALTAGNAARSATAASIQWGSVNDLVQNSGNYPQNGGQSANYSANSIKFTDMDGNLIQNNPAFSLIYFVTYGDGSSAIAGGLDGSGGSATGFLNKETTYYSGLSNGQTVNSADTGGYWKMFVDVNGNGKYGTYDTQTGLFIAEDGEYIAGGIVSGSDPFVVGSGTLSAGDISGRYNAPIPEPTFLALLGVGAGALAWTTNVISISVQAAPLNCRFYVHVCTNLATANWSDALPGGCLATGTVTAVTHTNAAPQGFYRASSQPTGAP